MATQQEFPCKPSWSLVLGYNDSHRGNDTAGMMLVCSSFGGFGIWEDNSSIVSAMKALHGVEAVSAMKVWRDGGVDWTSRINEPSVAAIGMRGPA